MSRADAPPPSPSPSGLRVLVADDYFDAALSLSHLVGRWGHETRAVRSAAAAAEAIVGFSPHVVLIETRMPRAAGVAAAAVSRAARGEGLTLLVSVSTGDEPADRRLRADMGIRRHFGKPVRPGELRPFLEGVAARAGLGACRCRG